MKKLLLLPIIFSLTAFADNEKRALIFAIGNYPDQQTNGWTTIASNHDTTFVKEALKKQNFAEKNIQVITDKNATKTGITNALENFVAKAGKGDICVIHFSSHGVQLEDDNGDEVDFKDECIVPYGARYTENPDEVANVTPGYLRDDDFGTYIQRLREKLGKDGDLLVTIDACHSGSATRSTDKCRGNKPALLSKNAKANTARGNVKETHSEFMERGAGANSNLAGFTIISAAQAEQPNWEIKDDEGKAVGPLSYSIYQALANNTDTNLTYRGLFASIQSIMNVKANRQQPVMEGDEKDRGVFGGAVIKQEPYFEISKSKTTGTALLKAGAIQGIYNGSKVAFYKPGEGPGTGTKIDSGEVVKSNNFYSTVQLGNKNASFTERQYWAYITEQNYGDGTIKVFVDDRNKQAEKIKAALKNDMIEFVPNNDEAQLTLDLWSGKDNWALFVGNTDLYYDTSLAVKTAEDFQHLKDRIKDFNQYLFLQKLKNTTKDLNAKLEIIPIVAGKPDTHALKAMLDTSGILELEDGAQVVLRITNTDKANAYINILDLSPTGDINTLMPCETSCTWTVSASEMKVKSGETVLLDNKVVDIAPPFGTEVLKIFVTREPLNLEYIKSTRGAGETKGMKSAFDKFFKSTYALTRGTSVSIDPDGTVFSYPFKIVPKKLVAEK